MQLTVPHLLHSKSVLTRALVEGLHISSWTWSCNVQASLLSHVNVLHYVQTSCCTSCNLLACSGYI